MTFLTEPFRARTWREQAWAVAAFGLGTFWFTVLVTLLSTGVSLAITLVGLPLLALTLWLAAAGARVERAWARLALGVEVGAPPEPARREEPALRRFLHSLVRTDRWRAVLYLLLLFPLGVVEFTVAVTLWSCALAGIAAPLWIPFVPAADRPDLGNGAPARDAVGRPGARPAPRRAAASAPRTDARRARAGRDRRAARPGRRDRGPAGARHRAGPSRRRAGAARCARRRPRPGPNPPRAGRAAGGGRSARPLGSRGGKDRSGRDPRSRARHPPGDPRRPRPRRGRLRARSPRAGAASGGGLGASRPPPEVETAAYYVVSEALANLARHSGATRGSVGVIASDGRLDVVVSDDGSGGADESGGSGLAGLRERVAALGGGLGIVSPPGGGTTVHAWLPCG